MKRITVGTGLVLWTACVAFGQASAQGPTFEVASVKVSPPSTDGRVIRGSGGGPGSTDPGTFTASNMPLKPLLVRAYNVKTYQIEGPEWLDSDGFDITAKIRPGATVEEFRVMLQNLLAERFGVVVRRENKQIPVYALIVGKGGHKMKEVDVPAPVPGGPAGGAPGFGGPPQGAVSFGGGRGGGPSISGSKGPGVRMMMTPSGRQLAGYMTMTQLANSLSNSMDRAVVDLTELTATYDVDITWMPDESDRMASRMGGVTVMAGGPGGGGGGMGPGGEGVHASDPALTLAQALQEKLGLKLDPRKSPAEMLIIDKANRIPVEN